MTTVQVPTSKLVGTALDWAVLAATEGNSGALAKMRAMASRLDRPADILGGFHPSTDWSRGGPLIDKYDIALNGGESESGARVIYATLRNVPKDAPYACSNGPTRLIAAMRAIVTAKLGDTVEIPKEIAK